VQTSTPEQLKTLVQKEVIRCKVVVTAARITADGSLRQTRKLPTRHSSPINPTGTQRT
jgi:hypothetical protein